MTTLIGVGERGELHVVAWGTPAPQGSKTHVGRGRLRESSEATLRPWREAIKYAAVQAMPNGEPWVPFEGPIRLTIDFYLARPTTAPRRVWRPIKKRDDLDKLLRGVMDALTDAGVWNDDGQVVEIVAAKWFAAIGQPLHSPGARMSIEPLEWKL